MGGTKLCLLCTHIGILIYLHCFSTHESTIDLLYKQYNLTTDGICVNLFENIGI